MTIGHPRNTKRFGDNPTANSGLRRVQTKYSPIKNTPISDISKLEVMCTKCTKFDKDSGVVKKVVMKYEERHELFRCVNVYNHVFSEEQIRYAYNLQLPEFIHYDKKKKIGDINKEREEHEKFVINPINAQSPTDLLKRDLVKAVKNKPVSTDHNLTK